MIELHDDMLEFWCPEIHADAHLANSMTWRTITGHNPPLSPFTVFRCGLKESEVGTGRF